MSRASKSKTAKKIIFRKHVHIGANDAIEDKEYLSNCFVDTGEYGIISNTSDHRSIILGRTGAGKTALLEILKEREERVVVIDPDTLALTYLASNSALSFYSEAGVKIDIFYRMLWRHIFVVEIIRAFFDNTNESKNRAFLENLKLRIFQKKSDEGARDYLVKWGESFWKETDYQITEYTQKLEKELNQAINANIGAKLPAMVSGGINIDRSSAEKLTKEQKSEIIKYAQPVVDAVQIRQMAEVITLLENELLDDRQKTCFIVIDRLDEQWINDDLRYRLIRALIEAIRYMNNKLSTVKIVVSIREDLLQRVFRFTRDAGDQEEKYESLYLRLYWQTNDLEAIINRRINKLLRDQYTKQSLFIKDVLPKQVLKQPTMEYIVERTLRTPRDIIMFFNACLNEASGKTKINQTIILAAETRYSEARLKALGDEWSADYTDLVSLIIAVLKKKHHQFRLGEVEIEDFEHKMLDFLTQPRDEDSYTYKWILRELYEYHKPRQLLNQVVKEFYKIGVLGVKLDTYREVYWSYMGKTVTEGDLTDETKCYIHPAFFRVLGIFPPKK